MRQHVAAEQVLSLTANQQEFLRQQIIPKVGCKYVNVKTASETYVAQAVFTTGASQSPRALIGVDGTRTPWRNNVPLPSVGELLNILTDRMRKHVVIDKYTPAASWRVEVSNARDAIAEYYQDELVDALFVAVLNMNAYDMAEQEREESEIERLRKENERLHRQNDEMQRSLDAMVNGVPDDVVELLKGGDPYTGEQE